MTKILHNMRLSIVFSMLMVAMCTVAQQRVYVSTTGGSFTTVANHGTWGDATSELQTAINALSLLPSGGEIWIAKGTYIPTEIYNGITDNERNKSIILKNNVKLVGGFAGTETELSERINYGYNLDTQTAEENATIFDGDLGTAKCYHVVFLGNLTNQTAIIEDVIITNGNANEASLEEGHTNSNYFGGGVYARNGGHFSNCYFINNEGSFGGAGYCVSAIFEDCHFAGNYAIEIPGSPTLEGHGGALYLHEESTVSNCVFRDNECDENGGAIYATGSTFTNLTFFNNTAQDYGGAVCSYGDGGGTYDGGTFTSCIFYNNTSGQSGGAIAGLNGGTFDDCTIYSNYGNRGGGVYLFDANARLINSHVYENTIFNTGAGVYSYGGYIQNTIIENNEGTGVYLRNGTLSGSTVRGNYDSSQGAGVYSRGISTITDCYIYNNNSTSNGGGVFVSKVEDNDETTIVNTMIFNNFANVSGGGVYVTGIVNVLNSSIVQNRAENSIGQGVLCTAPTTPENGSTFVNSIIWGNSGAIPTGNEIDFTTDVSASFSYTAVEEILFAGDGNVELAPTDDMFVLATSFVSTATTPEQENEFTTADWRLKTTSACFNAGTPDISGLNIPATDLLGNQRVYKDRIDMGAIEVVYYDITVSSTGEGSVTPSTDIVALDGGSIDLSLEPTAGNGISDVTINSVSIKQQLVSDGDGTYSYALSNIDEDKAISVTFVPIHTINISAGTGGTASPIDDVEINEGDDQSIIITPESGYKITSLTANGVDVLSGLVENTNGTYTYTVINVDEDVAIVIEFTQFFVVTTSAGLGGVIAPDGSTDVFINDQFEVLLTPNDGYKVTSITANGNDVFDELSDNGDETYTYTILDVMEDVAIEVGFSEYFTITITSNEGGVIGSDLSVDVLNSDVHNVLITPNSGYLVRALTINGADILSQLVDNGDGTFTLQIDNVSEDISLDVVFDIASGIDSLSKSNIKVYPTVTNGLVSIDGEYDRIDVVGLTGAIVKQIDNNVGSKLELTDLERGTYILIVYHQEGRELFKIIKK